VPVYDGRDLRPGCKLPGPLLIEERTTTAFIGPRDSLEVDARDDFLVHIDGNAHALRRGATPPGRERPARHDHERGRDLAVAEHDTRLEEKPMTPDPVTLALVQSRLDHISHQMGWVMTRTARSPIFSQSHDFSCFIADARGTLISQADGIPIHTGGGGFAVRAILRDFAAASSPRTCSC
jgi:hypothetical protein